MVIATQNPVEHEGTYPLPESQLDRFLMRISMGYPSRQSELEILDAHASGGTLGDLRPVATVRQIQGMVDTVKAIHVASALKHYLVDLADATRRHPNVALGMSPRATLSLQRASRARAAAAGRGYVIPDDIKALAGPVLRHRLMLSSDAELQGIGTDKIIGDVLTAVPVPTAR
jgi:MoxR-like ATPase